MTNEIEVTLVCSCENEGIIHLKENKTKKWRCPICDREYRIASKSSCDCIGNVTILGRR